MKLILPLLLPILLSCSDISVYFENTQPLDGKVLKEFPKKFRNKYKKGIRTAEFTNDQYILIENFQQTVQIDSLQLDSTIQITKDSLVTYENGERKAVKYDQFKDSIHFQIIDTSIYTLGDNIELIKSRKNYFINVKHDEFWFPFRLVWNKMGIIQVKTIMKREYSLATQHGVKSSRWLPSREDSLRVWSPGFTKKQIDRFIKEGGFSGNPTHILSVSLISDSTMISND